MLTLINIYAFQGDDPRRSLVQVPIKVMNKATPVFGEPFYTVTIPEDIPLGSTVITIEANSPTDGKLIYSISDGDIYGEFAINFNTGIHFLTSVHLVR